MNESDLQNGARVAAVVMTVGFVLLVAASAMAFVAIVVPVEHRVDSADVGPAEFLASCSRSDADMEPLLWEISGRQLIRPSQQQAAVKDSGLAQRLLSRLKLEGVLQIGSARVAYIRIDGKVSQTVRDGEQVLDFTVAGIQPGTVTLLLDGVSVVLAH